MNHVIIYTELLPECLLVNESNSYVARYLISNLLKQYSQDYKCFIEYPLSAEASMALIKNEFTTKTNKISLVPQMGKKYETGVWREREIISRIDQYVHSLKLGEKDTLVFIYMPCYAIYTCNMVSYFKNYRPLANEKVIQFGLGYRSGKNTLARAKNIKDYVGFAYLCSVREFDMYFKSYILIKEFKFEEFINFPKRSINEVGYIIRG